MPKHTARETWAALQPDRVFYDGRCEAVVGETDQRPRRRCQLAARYWHDAGFAVCRVHAPPGVVYEFDKSAQHFRRLHTEVSADTIPSAYTCEAWHSENNSPCIARGVVEDADGTYWCRRHAPKHM